MPNTVLILGASGRFGRNAAEAFEASGWNVRKFVRGNDLTATAKGADVIVNAWNPKYPDWATQIPKLTRQVIAAAKASGATVVLPGNVYNYGKDAPEKFGPGAPQMATNPLGAIRRTMEAAYRDAGVPTIVLRGGDFLDTEFSGNWFDKVLTAKSASGTFVYPGAMKCKHAWAYLPDIARALVLLVEKRNELPTFADIAFPGYTLSGQEIMDLVSSATGVPQTKKNAPWAMIWAARPIWPTARGLWEMRYLWSKPHYLDGSEFHALLPNFDATPVHEAIRAALQVEVRPDQAVAGRGFHGGQEAIV